MPMQLVETRAEFIARHSQPGLPLLPIDHDDYPAVPLYGSALPTGALIVRGPYMAEQFIEPSKDELQRLQIRLAYFETLSALAEKAFHSIRNAWLGVGPPYRYYGTRAHKYLPHCPSEDVKVILAHLRDCHIKYRAAIKAMCNDYDALPHVKKAREAAKIKQEIELRARQAEQMRLHELRTEVMAISLRGDNQAIDPEYVDDEEVMPDEPDVVADDATEEVED